MVPGREFPLAGLSVWHERQPVRRLRMFPFGSGLQPARSCADASWPGMVVNHCFWKFLYS